MLRQVADRHFSRSVRWETLLLGVAVALAVTSAVAQTPQYNTANFVRSVHNECIAGAGCVSFQQGAVGVPPGRSAVARFACPATHPNVWGWDVAQHEHVGVKLVDIDGDTITVEGRSRADAAGSFIVFLGCSALPNSATSLMNTRNILPTGAPVAKGR